MEHQSPAQWVFIAAIIGLLIFRNVRPQKLSLARIWVVPVMLVVVTLFAIWGTAQAEPAPLWMTIAALVIGAAAGTPLGLARGRHSRVRLADTPGTVVIDPSIAVLLIWVGAFAIKFGMRYFLPHAGPVSSAASDAFIALAAASVITSRWVVFNKARALERAQGAAAR